VPQVASDPKSHVLKALAPHAPARPAPERSPAAPFESLLDDSPPPPAPLPARSAADDSASRPEPRARAKSKTADRADPAKAGDETPAKAKPAAADKAEAPAGDPKVATAGKATGVKTTDQATSSDEAKASGDGKPADAQLLADPTAPQTVAAPIPAVAATDAIATVLTPAPDAAANPETPAENAAVVIAAAGAKTGPAAPQQADDGKAATAAKFADKPTAETAAKLAPPADARPQADAKPKAEGDKPNDADKTAVAHARGEAPAKENRAAMLETPSTPTTDAAPKSNTGATQQAAQADTSHNPTPPAVSPAAPMPPATAIPLAGVAVEIAGKALLGKNHFEIRLDPPELGRIEVRLDVDRDGNVTSRLIADRQDTLDLLRRDSSGLERALQDAGLKTGDNGMQFSLRDQSNGQQQSNGGAHAARLVVADDTLPAVEGPHNGYLRLAGQGSGIDIHV
jgi:flagellar hook-length control protein FliK